MSDPPRMTDAEIARMVRQHVDSLRAAGVEWLPAAKFVKAAPVLLTEETPVPVDPTPARPAEKSDLQEQPSLSKTSVDPPTARPAEKSDPQRTELTLLVQEVAACTRCSVLVGSRTQTVFGVGPLGAELCLVGEAPGADEDAQGEPFVGAAGKLLNRIIVACGFQREEVYICNTIKCRPPNNRTPLADEMANCRHFLERQIDLVKPKFICALGSCAAQSLLSTTQSIGKLRGRFHDFRGIPVVCTYHPAYLLPHRNPDAKKWVWDDMKMLLARMGRPVPEKNRRVDDGAG